MAGGKDDRETEATFVVDRYVHHLDWSDGFTHTFIGQHLPHCIL